MIADSRPESPHPTSPRHPQGRELGPSQACPLPSFKFTNQIMHSSSCGEGSVLTLNPIGGCFLWPHLRPAPVPHDSCAHERSSGVLWACQVDSLVSQNPSCSNFYSLQGSQVTMHTLSFCTDRVVLNSFGLTVKASFIWSPLI